MKIGTHYKKITPFQKANLTVRIDQNVRPF